MDEIGFLVSHINSKGFVFVDPVGGFDPRNLFSRRVLICTEKEDIRAVMNPQGKRYTPKVLQTEKNSRAR
ncbi:MAG: hypothetical protein CM15mP73_1370 [Hyphomicrobiales bacterium]|nr:MAG: hypothetical protein CM15mP73_1370 [Hyphomicrobiales bacterium]